MHAQQKCCRGSAVPFSLFAEIEGVSADHGHTNQFKNPKTQTTYRIQTLHGCNRIKQQIKMKGKKGKHKGTKETN